MRMVAADREARVRALAYVAKLSKEEWERRQDPDFIEPYLLFDPKERDASFGADVYPVCSVETFVVEEIDSFGLGIGARDLPGLRLHEDPRNGRGPGLRREGRVRARKGRLTCPIPES